MEMLKNLEEKRLEIEVEGAWCGGLLYAERSGGVASDVGCGGEVRDEVEMKWKEHGVVDCCMRIILCC